MSTDSTSLSPSGGLTPWTLWAKWSPISKTPNSYHPLLCHLIDVAMVAEAMWRRVLPDAWKQRLAEGLGLDLDATERWVVFWAGLHDLGKACPGFQLQLHDPVVQALLQARLQSAGLPADPAPWVAHGPVSTHALRTLLPERFGLPLDVAYVVATAVGGHHGVFPPSDEVIHLSSDAVGRNPWPNVRQRYAGWLAEAVGVPPNGARPVHITHAAAMALAGFVSVVDWIGSSEQYFPHAAPDAIVMPTLTIADYRADAQKGASQALDDLGWTGWTPPQDAAGFTALFPRMEPRPVQREIITLAQELEGPAIVVIEAPMGEGKTEAAMYLADTWSVKLGQRGIYFALPTQATSEGMFTRVRDFLEQRYPHDVVNLQLLHGHAALSAVFQELRDYWRRLVPEGIYAGTSPAQRQQDGAVVAAEWFASGKRALLAPFGVGTVDQALLAALQVMHVFVRLYGLSTKTVIVDEVHAYDTYMSTLMERLLKWLGALQVPVVLLSATLPAARRQALLAAYSQGAKWPEPVEAAGNRSASAPYPRVTWASASEWGARAVETSLIGARTVHLGWLPSILPTADAPYPLGERLQALLADGGCAAVICNTVGRAQEVYHALQPFFPGRADDGLPTLDLFHARFPFEERAEREKRVLTRFGKQGGRPNRAVLVATQVIEQSLDLDFDVMITDLAPADLVLQRLGRLQRHDRTRPVVLRVPWLYIVTPEEDVFHVPTFDRGSEKVYDPHILLRSWLALRDRAQINVPDDVEALVEAIYGEAECPADVTPDLRRRWEETWQALQRDQEHDQQEAKNRYVGPPDSRASLAELARVPREEDAPELHPAFQALTRLSELTVSVVCLAGTEERPLLRPHGPAVNLKHKPTLRETQALLKRSLAITDRRVVRMLLERDVPSGWRESALLRRHRVLCFGPDGTVALGKWRLRLDPNLGLLIEGA